MTPDDLLVNYQAAMYHHHRQRRRDAGVIATRDGETYTSSTGRFWAREVRRFEAGIGALVEFTDSN